MVSQSQLQNGTGELYVSNCPSWNSAESCNGHFKCPSICSLHLYLKTILPAGLADSSSPWVPASSEGSTTGRCPTNLSKARGLSSRSAHPRWWYRCCWRLCCSSPWSAARTLALPHGKYFVETCAKLVLSLRRNGCVRFPGLSNIFLLRFSDAKTNFKPLEIR